MKTLSQSVAIRERNNSSTLRSFGVFDDDDDDDSTQSVMFQYKLVKLLLICQMFHAYYAGRQLFIKIFLIYLHLLTFDGWWFIYVKYPLNIQESVYFHFCDVVW